MEKGTWTLSEIINFACECFVLDDKLMHFRKSNSTQTEDLKLIRNSYKKEIIRIINKELNQSNEYKNASGRYFMDITDAKKLILTNKTVRKYFLKQMYKDQYALDAYFESKDDELNKKILDKVDELNPPLLLGQDICGYTFYSDEPDKAKYEEQMKLILFDFLFDNSLDNMFSQYGIDGNAYRKDFEARQLLIEDYTPVHYQRGYSFLDFKLKHPTIYYPLDSDK